MTNLSQDAIERINLHLEETPVYQDSNVQPGDVKEFEDLKNLFDYVTDEDLRNINPEEWVPESYDEEEIVISESSGTTGDRKKIYWHNEDVQDNIEYVAGIFDEQADIPNNENWVGTTTHNEILDDFLYGISDQFNGEMELIEVNPAPVKKALLSEDENKKKEIMDPIVEPIVSEFRNNDVTVYEDIPPMMLYTASQLTQEEKENVECLLIGGVGTSPEAVEQLRQTYPNADVLGWYGDYMNGLNAMVDSDDLEYSPDEPYTIFDVRDIENLEEPVEVGQEGEVISYSIRKGYFVPNRRTGDKGVKTEEGIKQISRLEG